MLKEIQDWFGLSLQEQSLGLGHGHAGGKSHGHTHGTIDPTIATTTRGIWAIKWSFVVLAITSLLQLGVVAISGSVALLARAETLVLLPSSSNPSMLESASAPAEAHEFNARLILSTKDRDDVQEFRMSEPAGHAH